MIAELGIFFLILTLIISSFGFVIPLFNLFNRIEITQKKTNHTIKNSFPKFARELLAERKHGDNPVFSGLQGFNYQNSYRQLTYDRFKRWRNRAGVSKDKTLHTFRHTYANNLYKRCNNIYEVSKALGHKKLETTLQFYAPESKFDQNSAFIEDAYNFI